MDKLDDSKGDGDATHKLFKLKPGKNVIGRAEEQCDICIPNTVCVI